MNIGKPTGAAMGLRPACSRIIYDYTHLRAKWLHSPRSFIVLGRALRPLVPCLLYRRPFYFLLLFFWGEAPGKKSRFPGEMTPTCSTFSFESGCIPWLTSQRSASTAPQSLRY